MTDNQLHTVITKQHRMVLLCSIVKFDPYFQTESKTVGRGSFIPVKMPRKSSVCSAMNALDKALCEIKYTNEVVVRGITGTHTHALFIVSPM